MCKKKISSLFFLTLVIPGSKKSLCDQLLLKRMIPYPLYENILKKCTFKFVKSITHGAWHNTIILPIFTQEHYYFFPQNRKATMRYMYIYNVLCNVMQIQVFQIPVMPPGWKGVVVVHKDTCMGTFSAEKKNNNKTMHDYF